MAGFVVMASSLRWVVVIFVIVLDGVLLKAGAAALWAFMASILGVCRVVVVGLLLFLHATYRQRITSVVVMIWWRRHRCLRLTGKVGGEQWRGGRSETSTGDWDIAVIVCCCRSGRCGPILNRCATGLQIVLVTGKVIAVVDLLGGRRLVAFAVSQQRFAFRSLMVMITMT